MTTHATPDPHATTGGRSRVLVVDDEPQVLGVCARMLEAAGFEVERAVDGIEAVERVAATSFDVVVSDIGIPGLDGVQLLRAVRLHDLDVPVILMTGAPAVDTAIAAVELGALRYLEKPFLRDVFVGAVEHAARLHQIAKLKRTALSMAGTFDHQPGDLASLGASFERALDTMRMAYQPIVSWSRREPYAFEALLRSDERTLPHPGAIIEAAERLHRLEDLGRAIRRRVAAEIDDAPSEFVFVNLHTHDLMDETLYSPRSPLSKHAQRVVLEITERAALDDVKDASARVAALRKLGFRIAIDDLGAGYAGLTSFAQLEPEVVKFDMSLIRGVEGNETKRKLIRSMTRLFDELGLQVIAEGVETDAERDALVDIGCGLLQGYLFARPGTPYPGVTW